MKVTAQERQYDAEEWRYPPVERETAPYAAFLISLWLQQKSCTHTINKEPMFPAANLRGTGSDHKTRAWKVINCPILSDLILLFRQRAHYSFMFRF